MGRVKLLPFTVEVAKEKNDFISHGIQMIKAPEMWKKGEEGEGIVIAVLDTGCQTDHPALKNRIIGGRNFTSDYRRDPRNYSDNNGHGTHVAGTIAGEISDGKTIGVAPKAKLLILKVLSEDGSGDDVDMIRAIHYAIEWRGKNKERVRVMSLSLGTEVNHRHLHNAIKRAVNNNIVVVCAAGNMGDGDGETEEKHYPGAYPEVIQTGAVDQRRKIAYFSNTNHEVDVVAPGVDILSAYPGGKYAKMSGTSMATPHVSGAAALIINQCERDFNRTLSEAEIYAQVCKRTVSLGYSKWQEGNGLLVLV